MTKEEFMEILEDKGYYYNGEGESIVVDHKGNLDLSDLEEIPSGIEFSNRGYISLDSLKVVPPGVKFDNSGNVWLNSVESLSPDTYFGQLTDEVFLTSLKRIPPGVTFENGSVGLKSILNKRGGRTYTDYFSNWPGNLWAESKMDYSKQSTISSGRLLTKMVSLGLFDRK